MKIKSIDDFTLTECQEYLDTNPNGEFAQEVVQRMEYLQQIIARRSQRNNARWINEFNTEFNRHFATQRYEEAFAICLKYLSKVDRKAEIVEKANSVIPKLKNRIQLPSSVTVSYDWLIDQLELNGYDKMKYDGNSLRWQKSRIIIKTETKISEIISKCRINFAIRIICIPMLLCVTMLIAGVTEPIGRDLFYPHLRYPEYRETYNFYIMLIIGILCAMAFLYWWLLHYIKMHKEPKQLLRRIANIIIDNFSKQ